jgi:EAL domain-containing protein (putative c-di-GMP-specific phosphodiesterase class I)
MSNIAKYIKQLPVDKIKIDLSFIKGININEKDEAIIKVIIVLAKNLGLKVIDEGVETKQQLDFLRELMCDEIQGYYYYKPMKGSEIEELSRKLLTCPNICTKA